MRIRYGDIWQHHHRPDVWVVVTTNTEVRCRNGTAVMGAGLAKQAALRFPDLPRIYGQVLQEVNPETGHPWASDDWHNPQLPWLYTKYRLVLFPTKVEWRLPSRMDLIHSNLYGFIQSWHSYCAEELDCCVNNGPYVAFPPLGCGHGGRDWVTEIEPMMSRILTSDRYVAVLPEDWRPI
jgi:hypothetical protein